MSAMKPSGPEWVANVRSRLAALLSAAELHAHNTRLPGYDRTYDDIELESAMRAARDDLDAGWDGPLGVVLKRGNWPIFRAGEIVDSLRASCLRSDGLGPTPCSADQLAALRDVLDGLEEDRPAGASGDVAAAPAGEPPGALPSNGKPKVSAATRALAVALEMTQAGEPLVIARIAERAGCSERYLHKCDKLKAFVEASKGEVLRGRKDRDTGRTEASLDRHPGAEDWPDDEG